MKKFETKKVLFFETIALLVGGVIGAGYLGIPFVVARLGLLAGLALIIVTGLLIMLVFLAVAEISLRTRAMHQIPGYVSKYLGRRFRTFIYTVVFLGGYGAMLAFLVGEGQVLSAIFGGPPLAYSLAFFAVTAFFIFRGLRTIKRVDLFLTILMFTTVVLIALLSSRALSFEKPHEINLVALLPAYGVMLFAFLGATVVPEMRLALKGQEKKLSKAIIIGSIIPIIIYLIFTVVVVGVNGGETTEIATIGLGQALGRHVEIIGNILAAITMLTGFLGIALALKEIFRYDLRFHKNTAWAATVFVPLLLFLAGIKSFVDILAIVGSLFGGLIGIFLVLTWWKAEKHGDRKPEFVLPHKKLFGYTLLLVFSIGFVYTIIDVFYAILF